MNRRQPPGGFVDDVFDFGNTDGSPHSNPHHRITRPPGGETNEIFNSPQSTPPSTPRKVKNYQQSNIFTPDYQGGEQRNIRHRPDDDSFKRLFGAQGSDSTDSPRVKNNQKSSIIFADNGVATNGTNGHTNGHTNGTNGHSNGHTNGHSNGTNGTTNGHHENGGSGSSTPNGTSSPSNGLTNGGSNGHVNGNSPKINGTNGVHAENGVAPGKRIPPGGFSSKLW